ncbi:hypothetical protein ALP84_05212 [Pseudomonas cichorii]|uniref:Uncharacterized protein n=1 Tax=Pseudomonas cichorii TaxID=36746 RepID=A0A3M4W5F2_PSECI|nr:hypothetical protein ALP84_05212 [Pseudomonas cichorii]
MSRVRGPALETLPAVLVRLPASRLSVPSLLIRPWLLSSAPDRSRPRPCRPLITPPVLSSEAPVRVRPVLPDSTPSLRLVVVLSMARVKACCASTWPPLLVRVWPVRVMPCWLEISPPWLSMSSTVRVRASPAPTKPLRRLFKVSPVRLSEPRAKSCPPCCCRLPITAVRAFWLENSPWALLPVAALTSRSPSAITVPLTLLRAWSTVRVISARLLIRPSSLVRLSLSRVRPVADTVPLRLRKNSTRSRVRAWLPSSLPPLLSSDWALRVKAWALEISPPWLSTALRFFSSSAPGLLIRPPWLFSCPLLRSRLRVVLLNSSPPCWSRLVTLAVRASALAMRPALWLMT